MAAFMFTCIVVYDTSSHIPLILGCLAAGLVALSLGYSWEEILEGMIEGITDSLEAILILLLIGVLCGAWISAGTVPTMIYYGLKLISVPVFLPASMLICMIVAAAIGSWGTVGTIGLALMGIGLALEIPAPLAAGAVISGAYMGEVVSPLSDATNLAAAVAGETVFSIVKRILPAAAAAGILAVILYAVTGLGYAGGDAAAVRENIDPILASLKEQFRITPAALLPMALIVICILVKVPAIPSMLFGGIFGMLMALILQRRDPGSVIKCACSGYVSRSGIPLVDELLTAGGLEGMLEPVSIILIAMSFGGIMKKTRQMEALVAPVIARIKNRTGMSIVTVFTCIFMNIILPDQYLGISMPAQMYRESYDQRKIGRAELGATILGGGAVTSPLIPWNTCGIYCMTILGVSPLLYARYTFYGILLPAVTIMVPVFSAVRNSKRNG